MSEPVSVSFRYVEVGKRHCLSHCTQDEVRHYKNCLRILTTLPWKDVLASGGHGENKAGLSHTPYKDYVLTGVRRPQTLSRDLGISAVRATQKARLFGAYGDGIYYILWFDRNHEIVPD
jgi:hypothetical protein